MYLWKKWKETVDKHNEKQSYATAEECWDYDTIFYPLYLGIIFFLISIPTRSIILGTIFGIAAFILMGIMLFINWICNN